MTEDSQAPEAAPDTPPAPAAPVHDDYLTSGDRFVRWNLGEGLAKKEDDFVNEVARMAKGDA